MTSEQQAHLNRVAEKFDRDVRQKYQAGQKEHGGDLFRKAGMMRQLRAEVLDLVVYQDTMDEQIRSISRELSTAITAGDWTMVNEAVDRLNLLLDGETDSCA